MQELFLKAYPAAGNIYAAAIAAGVSERAARYWNAKDTLGFKARLEAAMIQHREYLETQMFDRISNPQGNRGSDILLIFALKGAWPDRYRDVTVATDDTAKEILAQISKMQRERRRGTAAKPSTSDEETTDTTG